MARHSICSRHDLVQGKQTNEAQTVEDDIEQHAEQSSRNNTKSHTSTGQRKDDAEIEHQTDARSRLYKQKTSEEHTKRQSMEVKSLRDELLNRRKQRRQDQSSHRQAKMQARSTQKQARRTERERPADSEMGSITQAMASQGERDEGSTHNRCVSTAYLSQRNICVCFNTLTSCQTNFQPRT